MRGKSFLLLVLLLGISGWVLAPRIFAVQGLADSDSSATLAMSPQPTPLPPMPTPSATEEAQADWPTYTSPYWGISFRYPPDWQVSGAVEDVTLGDEFRAQRAQRSIGSPIMVSPATPSARMIYIILQSYTFSGKDSLADWVTVNYAWNDLIGMGMPPLHLFSIPAQYLPKGFDQGIYSINEAPYNAPHVLWLDHHGLIYQFSSTYNRPQDLAFLFAMISTVDFDPSIEQRLLAEATFNGDETVLHQQLAEALATPTPAPTQGCDAGCQAQQQANANATATMEAAINLPANQQPTPEAIPPATIDDHWITYTQPLMGVTFRYPADWTVDDPFNSPNANEATLLRTALTLSSKDRSQNVNFSIILSVYTIGKDTPLHNWEAIQDQRSRVMNSGRWLPYRQVVSIDPSYIPRQADDMIHMRSQIADSIGDNIYIRKGSLVFWILIHNRAAIPIAEAALSTLHFDETQLQKISSLDGFYGDERTMMADILKPTPTPYPTIDPLATATATPTSTPLIFATVTPSAFESPLVNGLKKYHGNGNESGQSPFELSYDPTIWQLGVNNDGIKYLVHQKLAECEINLEYIPVEGTQPLAPIELAGHEWSLSYAPRSGDVDYLFYYGGWDNSSFGFVLHLSEPLAANYDVNHKSSCELDAEAVLDTVTAIDTPASTQPPP